jgi:hypothetical protein
VDGVETRRLTPDEHVPERPFADAARTPEDLATLRAMRALLAGRLRDGTLPPADAGPLEHADGTAHWLCVPHPEVLAAARPVAAVGFFGQARSDVDHGPILEREHAIIARAAAFDGLLTYYNMRFADGRYGNLVLFESASAKAHVTADRVHGEAVARTPQHYHSLRLHHAELADGVLGAGNLELLRTRYLDFSGASVWSALREPALP